LIRKQQKKSVAVASPWLTHMNFKPSSGRKLVLCIDDDLQGLLIRKAVLESQGYAVLIATNGPAGIVIVREVLVDAVVVDYAMPEMDGAAVVVETRKIYSRVPIIMLSGHDVSEVPHHVLRQINKFVSKGSSPIEFLTALQEVVSEAQRAA
jgi:CheY-like chemotaxis protein